MKTYRVANIVYHNTKSEFLPAIKREGLTSGSFSDAPIDFGGDVWLAVDEDLLIDKDISIDRQKHQYGGVIALEPKWDSGRVVRPEDIYMANKWGKILGKLV